jgi:hypothetical protein
MDARMLSRFIFADASLWASLKSTLPPVGEGCGAFPGECPSALGLPPSTGAPPCVSSRGWHEQTKITQQKIAAVNIVARPMPCLLPFRAA